MENEKQEMVKHEDLVPHTSKFNRFILPSLMIILGIAVGVVVSVYGVSLFGCGHTICVFDITLGGFISKLFLIRTFSEILLGILIYIIWKHFSRRLSLFFLVSFLIPVLVINSLSNTTSPLFSGSDIVVTEPINIGGITKDWKTYRNEEYGFEFKYPPNYSTRNSTDINPLVTNNLTVYINYIDESSPENWSPESALITINAAKFSNPLSEEELSSFTACGFENQTKVKLDSIGVEATKCPSQIPTDKDYFLFPNADKMVVYSIGYIATTYTEVDGVTTYTVIYPNLTDEAQIIEKFLSTFKFIPSTSPGQVSTSTTPTISPETENIGEFVGYYTNQKRYWIENTGPYICDEFVILKGDSTITDYFKAMVEYGNSINRIDENGNLILAISLENISSEINTRVKRSTEVHPVQLTLKKKVQSGRGAPECYSFFDILSVD